MLGKRANQNSVAYVQILQIRAFRNAAFHFSRHMDLRNKFIICLGIISRIEARLKQAKKNWYKEKLGDGALTHVILERQSLQAQGNDCAENHARLASSFRPDERTTKEFDMFRGKNAAIKGAMGSFRYFKLTDLKNYGK